MRLIGILFLLLYLALVLIPANAQAGEVSNMRHIKGDKMILGAECPLKYVPQSAAAPNSLDGPKSSEGTGNRATGMRGNHQPEVGFADFTLLWIFLTLTLVVSLFKFDDYARNSGGALAESMGIAIAIIILVPVAIIALIVIAALSVPVGTAYLVTVRQI